MQEAKRGKATIRHALQTALETIMGVQNSPDAGLDEKAVIAAAERALSDIARIRQEVAKVIFGQESVVEQTMLAVLSGGHALLVGVPGLA